MTNKKTKEHFGNVVMYALLLSPILQTYGWGRFDFASLLTLLLASISLVLNSGKQQNIPFFLGLYFVYWYISHIIANDFPGSLFPLGIIKIALVYMMFYNYVKLNYLIKKYRIVALICIVYFVFQTISRYLFGFVLMGVFDFLPLSLDIDSADYFADRMSALRDSSFFSEPAIFVQFLFPLLAVELFYVHKKNWVLILSIVITLLLMRSGNALLGLFVIAIFYLISFLRENKTASSTLGYLVVIAISVVGLGIYLNSEMGQEVLERKTTIQSDSYETQGYAGSGFMRIYRGYFIYQEYSLKNKIIGNDNNDFIEQTINQSPYSWAFYDETYVNTVQAFLIYTGIIGTILFMLFFIKQWRATNNCGHVILTIFLALSFIAAMHFTEIMALYLLIPFVMNKEYKNDKQISYSRL